MNRSFDNFKISCQVRDTHREVWSSRLVEFKASLANLDFLKEMLCNWISEQTWEVSRQSLGHLGYMVQQVHVEWGASLCA